MATLVLGGTGTVGSAVVQELLKRGEAVRVATRSEEKVKTLPEKVQGVVGDLINPSTYGEMFSGAEKLFLLNAVNFSETQEGLAALNEAKKAGVQHIVYLSKYTMSKSLRTSPTLQTRLRSSVRSRRRTFRSRF